MIWVVAALSVLVGMLLAALVTLARLAVIEYASNVGSWGYQFGCGSRNAYSEFDVETRELTIGPWYFELVWGRWCK